MSAYKSVCSRKHQTMEKALKLARQLGAATAAQKSLKSLTTTVGSISEGAIKSVQEALKEYSPIPPSDGVQKPDFPVQSALMCGQWSRSALTRLVPLEQVSGTSKGGRIVAEERATTDS